DFVRYRTDIDPENLAADALALACKNIVSLKKDESFRAYLYRIARNKITDQYRRNNLISWLSWERVHKEHNGEETLPWEDDPRRFEQDIEQADFVRTVLSYAPPKCRDCLYLDIFEEYTQREIAEMLDISERTVRYRIAKGKEALYMKYGHFVDNLGALERKK